MKVNLPDENNQTPVFYAIRHGHIRSLRALLTDYRIDVNWRDRTDTTPISLAAALGFANKVGVLCTSGADIGIQDQEEQISLHHAARFGHHLVIRVLLSYGIDIINSNDHFGDTPLHHAARNGRILVTRELLKRPTLYLHGANKKGETPLHLAARFGHHLIISVLLLHDRTLANVKNHNEDTALHEAASSGHTSAVYELLRYETTSINEENSAGAKPLHLAILHHHLGIVQLLLNKRSGYNLHRSPSRGWKLLGHFFLVSQV
ncbi:hypothetical protein N7509_000073 [Penicillium cosmopolitanum]|uniref:Uncharacterized protein n=1 Tax=Penicillium cosmopolitanum TaxID=1131564 RepID=A0A9W9WCI5_9EURO|nr:uncharacterized protein N7509_000073 [Penicillium cosmopolitanum]KAJ5414975.1 hypothetical protein N7509_000073 [Penicillium cosmopolitanum]